MATEDYRAAVEAIGRMTATERADFEAAQAVGRTDAATVAQAAGDLAALVRLWHAAADPAERGARRTAIDGALQGPDSGPADLLGEALATVDPDDPDLAAKLRAAANPQPFEVEPADESEPPRREWLIRGWLPRGRLAAVYGRGEVGKSRLMLQVAHAVTCGGFVLPWDPDVSAPDTVRGDVPEVTGGGRVLLVTWEDEADEVRRRWRMAHAAGAVTTDRMPAEIAILDMRRHGAGALWGPKGFGHVSTRGDWTAAGRRVLAMLPDYDLAVLDPLASAYASSEIDRALVRGFAARLDSEAEAAECAVMLSAHPSQSGEKTASAESGSTDWRNAVRSRWVLGPQRTAHNAHGGGKNGKNEPIDAPCLALDKASYAPGRGRVWLRSHYQRGGGGEWDKLAWFATTGWAAAVAAHVRGGGKAGDVIGIGAGKDGDKAAEGEYAPGVAL